MKELLSFILTNITGSGNFTIEETSPEPGRINFDVAVSPDVIGLVIGKEGKTIKNIRKILSILATKEKMGVNINVTPLES